MPKFPKCWLGKNGKCKMCSGVIPNGEPQDLYFLEDHPDMPGFFKGMKKILEERGFTEADLCAECPWFKCAEPMVNGRLLLPVHTFQPARLSGPKTSTCGTCGIT